jgi:hypothetical protein
MVASSAYTPELSVPQAAGTPTLKDARLFLMIQISDAIPDNYVRMFSDVMSIEKNP